MTLLDFVRMRKKLLIGILTIVIIFSFYKIFFCSTVRNTFPFSKSDTIELIFYKEAQKDGTDLKKIGKIPFKKKVKLSEKEKEEIFEILYKENCFTYSMAACYEPRHALVFTKQNDTIGIIEICLECSQFAVTEGIEQPKMCDETAIKLDQFLKSKQ